MIETMGQVIEYVKSFGPPAEMPLANGKRMLLETWLRERINVWVSDYAEVLSENDEQNFYTETEVLIPLTGTQDVVMGTTGDLPADFLAWRGGSIADVNGRIVGGHLTMTPWSEWIMHGKNRYSVGTILKPRATIKRGSTDTCYRIYVQPHSATHLNIEYQRSAQTHVVDGSEDTNKIDLPGPKMRRLLQALLSDLGLLTAPEEKKLEEGE